MTEASEKKRQKGIRYANYLMFHTMEPELAVEDLKELYEQKLPRFSKKSQEQNNV